MAFFIVDLEFISNLEITLLKRLKPDEILLISYIKSFPKFEFFITFLNVQNPEVHHVHFLFFRQ